MFNHFLPKIVPFMRLREKKYSTAGQARDDNILWHMRIAYWINKAT